MTWGFVGKLFNNLLLDRGLKKLLILFNPILLKSVHPLLFSPYLRNGFCSEYEDVNGNGVKAIITNLFNTLRLHVLETL